MTTLTQSIISNIHALVRGDTFHTQCDSLQFARGTFDPYEVCYVWDPTAHAHKFIAALTPTRDLLMAMPLTLIELHKNILEYIHQAQNDDTGYCPGGGYLKVRRGHFITYGESQDFGLFDLDVAEAAFRTLSLPKKL